MKLGIYYDSVNNSYWYAGVEFKKDNTECMKEYVGNVEYPYVKINGKKYYLEKGASENIQSVDVNGTAVNVDANSKIFYIDSNGAKNYEQAVFSQEPVKFAQYYLAITENKSAYEYYKHSYEFSRAVLSTPVSGYKDKAGNSVVATGYGLSNLRTTSASIYNKEGSTTKLSEYGDFAIFGGENIEYPDSNFNKHRSSVIRYVVETNLETAISAFESNAGGTDFIMPKISETDWEVIENDVCAITFLQGLNLGDKKYNGYAVVANNLTTAYIDENDIYILKTDTHGNRTYSRPNDNTITSSNIITGLGFEPGIWKVNFEIKQDKTTDTTKYYAPLSYNAADGQSGYLASYTSIMGSSGLVPIKETGGIYNYMKNTVTNSTLKRAYYTALARERWGSYNDNNVSYEIYNGTGQEYFINSYP